MQVKRILQWAILAALAAASALNILYLTGTLNQRASSLGYALVIGCFVALFLLKKRITSEASSAPTRLDSIRGIATAVFAVIWIVTIGISLVWVR